MQFQSPSLVITKARKVAESKGISEDDFKCSWKWLSRFRKRRGMGSMLLHGEGAEVDRDDIVSIASRRLKNVYR